MLSRVFTSTLPIRPTPLGLAPQLNAAANTMATTQPHTHPYPHHNRLYSNAGPFAFITAIPASTVTPKTPTSPQQRALRTAPGNCIVRNPLNPRKKTNTHLHARSNNSPDATAGSAPMEDNNATPLFPRAHYGVHYEISEPLKQRLYETDLAPYTPEDIHQALESANAAATTQQLAEPQKHHPMDPQQTINFVAHRKPPLFFDAHTQNDDNIPLALAAAQGQRHNMEDAHIWSTVSLTLPQPDGTTAEVPVRFSALFDGHGGDQCAQFCASKLAELLKTHLTACSPADGTSPADSTSPAGIATGITHAIVALSHAYNRHNMPPAFYQEMSGSTLNLMLEIGDTVYFANLGDSRALFVDYQGKVQQLTEDHTLTCAQQRAQIEDRGGFVAHGRVNGRLAVPAALGAHWTHGAVSARPRITAFPTESLKNGVIVQACDGLFEVASTQQLGERIYHALTDELTLKDAAMDAVMAAYDCGSADNLSVMISKVGTP